MTSRSSKKKLCTHHPPLGFRSRRPQYLVLSLGMCMCVCMYPIPDLEKLYRHGKLFFPPVLGREIRDNRNYTFAEFYDTFIILLL